MANIHQRHAPQIQKSSSLSPTAVDFASPGKIVAGGAGRPGKLRRRRRPRPRRKGRILGCGLGGMGLLLVWFVVFRLRNVNETTTEPNSSTFLLQSNDAPECTTLESSEDISFTLVTQCSHDRLWMMKHHCERFANEHPMSIAVWANQSHAQIWDELQGMGCNSTFLSVQILDASHMPYDDYPVNRLRNLALSQVQTPYIIYIDADFWTSEQLFEILDSETVREALWKDPKLALVIPAFQLFRQCTEWVDCREENIPEMPFSLDDLARMIQKKHGYVFDPTNAGGHGTTKYKDWIKQDVGSLVEIDCLKSNRYEPFVVVRYCRDLPPFQPAFSGYGKNKMTWVMQLIRQGYALSQVGGAYLVHYPHLDSASRQKWNQAPDELKVGKQVDGEFHIRKPKKNDGYLGLAQFKRGQIDQLFLDFRTWLEESVPDQRRLPLCEKAQDDDSKLWIDHGNSGQEGEGVVKQDK